MNTRIDSPGGWRSYQARLQKAARRRRLLQKLPLALVISGCTLTGLALLFFFHLRGGGHGICPTARPVQPARPATRWPPTLPRARLAAYLNDIARDAPDTADNFVFTANSAPFTVQTTLRPKLQKYILGLLGRSRTVKAAVVVLDPFDGHILAMASHAADGLKENLCLQADFPAASLFKIVTAAAAMEARGYTPDTRVFFNGGKHTLYKNQLRASRGRYTMQIKFRNAFAASINPVFGKLGIFILGKALTAEYAARFLFGRSIAFDFPVAVSQFEIPTDDYGTAEIASGFNRKTRLSPLHAALLASVVPGRGMLAAPWVVKSIRAANDKVLFRARPGRRQMAVNKKTAAGLKVLMHDVVLRGTCRRTFRTLRRDRRFKGFDLGAKTGTINDRGDHFRYDWFTGYALAPGGKQGICISVLGVHGAILGTRSSELARAVIDYHFKSRP